MTKRLGNERGIIFLTVLILSLVFTVILVSSLSLMVSQTTSGQDVVADIRSEQLALGTFYRYQQAQIEGAALPAAGQEDFDQKNFTYTIQNPATAGPNNTSAVQVTINY